VDYQKSLKARAIKCTVTKSQLSELLSVWWSSYLPYCIMKTSMRKKSMYNLNSDLWPVSSATIYFEHDNESPMIVRTTTVEPILASRCGHQIFNYQGTSIILAACDSQVGHHYWNYIEQWNASEEYRLLNLCGCWKNSSEVERSNPAWSTDTV